jgi:hypothetical protein
MRKRTEGPGTNAPLSPVAMINLDPPDPARVYGGSAIRGDASDDDDRPEREGEEGIFPGMEGLSMNAPSPRAQGVEITDFIIRSPTGEAGEIEES